MKRRLITALRAVGLSLTTDANGEEHIEGIPDKVKDLARRITPEDYRMMYVLLMKYPSISAEWVVRGSGTILLEDDPVNVMRVEIEGLKSELEQGRQKLRYLEKTSNSEKLPGKRGRPKKIN